MKKFDHTQWLLLDRKTGNYYSLVTAVFGGRVGVDVAIAQRKRFMDLVLIGSRGAGKQAKTLPRNMYKVPKEDLETYQIYPAYHCIALLANRA